MLLQTQRALHARSSRSELTSAGTPFHERPQLADSGSHFDMIHGILPNRAIFADKDWRDKNVRAADLGLFSIMDFGADAKLTSPANVCYFFGGSEASLDTIRCASNVATTWRELVPDSYMQERNGFHTLPSDCMTDDRPLANVPWFRTD